MTKLRLSYSELIRIPNYYDRYEYLRIGGIVGHDTFGYDRYLNQSFYTSPEWRRFRNSIIIRDNGNDMAFEDHPIGGKLIIHHINPLSIDDFLEHSSALFDPDNVVSVSHSTHQAIHYGDKNLLAGGLVERSPNDTIPWR